MIKLVVSSSMVELSVVRLCVMRLLVVVDEWISRLSESLRFSLMISVLVRFDVLVRVSI